MSISHFLAPSSIIIIIKMLVSFLHPADPQKIWGMRW
jgi:hypothetical protein